MRLNPGAFNRFIANIGQEVEWKRAYSCPCVNEFSGAAQTDCPQCHGKGHIWDAVGVPGVVGVTAQKVNPQWQDFGNFEQGDMVMTVPADSALYDIGRFDQVILKNSTDRFNRIYVHGTGQKLDVPVEKIDRVFWLNANKTQQIEGGIPVVGDDGTMTWATGEPPIGTQYSITGTRFTTYFIWQELPSDRQEHQGALLPKRCSLRRWDLFGR